MRPVRTSFLSAIFTIGVVWGPFSLPRAVASETHAYVVAANDGYGVEDCLSGSNECGQVVADAWCEAHGHAAAISFGLQSHFTSEATKVSATMEPYVINCSD
jgi:hypothetical protein